MTLPLRFQLLEVATLTTLAFETLHTLDNPQYQVGTMTPAGAFSGYLIGAIVATCRKMLMPDQERSYVGSLERFLTGTEQDEKIVGAIMERLPKWLPHFFWSETKKKYLEILDVGSGDGRKSRLLCHELDKYGIEARVDAIEPTARQRQGLYNTFKGTPYLEEVMNDPFNEAKLDQKYDLVLFLHSLYQFDRTDLNLITEMQRVRDLLKPEGIGIVAIEHPESDLQSIKREVHKKFGMDEPLSLEMVESTLGHYNFLYSSTLTRRNPISMRYSICKRACSDDKKLARDLAFLFSDSLESFRELSDLEYEAAGRVIQEHLRFRSGIPYLNTPDALVWFAEKTLL